MKKVLLIFAITVISLLSLNAHAQVSNTEQGDKAPLDFFTGDVWIKEMVNDVASGYSVYKVTFEKEARTNWHTHPVKQIIAIAEGKAYYQEKGKPAKVLNRGDVIDIPAGVNFWIGATTDSGNVQIVVNPFIDPDKEAVKWLEKVTDEEYKSAQIKK